MSLEGQFVKELLFVSKALEEKYQQAADRAIDDTLEDLRIKTPPNDNIPRGRGVITGQMEKSWRANKKMSSGTSVVEFINDAPYSGYVDTGHAVPRRLVPGLYIENGLIHRTDRPIVVNPPDRANRRRSKRTGRFMKSRMPFLMVGTQTPFTKGLNLYDQLEDMWYSNLKSRMDEVKLEI